jgi:hypothetical protein
MRRTAALLSLLLSTQALAGPTERGWLSGVGVGLVGLGVGFATFGVSQQLIANDASALIKAYGTPSGAEAPAVSMLDKRAQQSSSLALVGFVVGGVALAGGLVLLVLDRPRETVSAWLFPTRDGVAAGVSAAW